MELILIGLVVFGVISLYVYYMYPKSIRMSFKESLDLCELPVITLVSNNIKLNFLLDTGSNDSIINKKLIHKNIKATKCENMYSSIMGMEGTSQEVEIYSIDLNYKNQVFTDNFLATDMDMAFSQIKQDTGVQLHGILGVNFFTKYKYILNFDKLIAESKKK
jgi:hypothetical protein